jgi:hypothetical protein
MPNLSDEPTGREGEADSQQLTVGSPRSREDWIPAYAGMTTGAKTGDQDREPGEGSQRAALFGRPFSRPRRPLPELRKLLDLHVTVREAGDDVEFPAHCLDVAAQRAHENRTRTHATEYPK